MRGGGLSVCLCICVHMCYSVFLACRRMRSDELWAHRLIAPVPTPHPFPSLMISIQSE